MKKITIAAILILTTLAFKVVSVKNTATVEQQQGLYIFLHCKPSAEYNYLGSVKSGMAMTGQPQEMLPKMINKVKKEYPDADGIIFTSEDMKQVDAVKFKD
jgi:hypothetical protein